MSAHGSSAFNPRVVLGLLTFGAAAFLAMLWFIGSGQTDAGANNGQAHAASRGLTGYSALADMLAAEGHEVSLSRNAGALTREALLVLTPPAYADGAEIAEIIANRRFTGPTILVLPKWNAVRAPRATPGAKDGWVITAGAIAPPWLDELTDPLAMDAGIAKLGKGAADWSGIGRAGVLPDRSEVQGLVAASAVTLVDDSTARTLVGYLDDGGCYPVLDEAAGVITPADCDTERWGVTVVSEPDLFNNYGMADRDRALLASRIVQLAREGQDLPVVFDLTLNGLGKTQNLLTLAFSPPFLAATICLILAMVVVAWRAFHRFGAPIAEAPAMPFGKARLVANGAGFIQRTRRLHLLAEPYAALVARRLAGALHLRQPEPVAIDAALAHRAPDTPAFSARADALRNARGASAILRAAHALHTLERTVSR